MKKPSEPLITLITLMSLIKQFSFFICGICAIRGICGSDIHSIAPANLIAAKNAKDREEKEGKGKKGSAEERRRAEEKKRRSEEEKKRRKNFRVIRDNSCNLWSPVKSDRMMNDEEKTGSAEKRKCGRKKNRLNR